MRDMGLRVVAFLAFAALLAGSVWAAYAFLAVEGADVRTLDATYTVTPGSTFTVPYTLMNTGSVPQTLALAVHESTGIDLAPRSTSATVAPFEETAGWLTLTVPAGTKVGPRVVEVEAVADDGSRLGATTFTLQVLDADGGAVAGQVVPVWYVGRFEDGTVFDTNREAIADGPWPKAREFQRHSSWEAIDVQVGPVTNLGLSAFARAVEGMKGQETRTIVLGPDDAYGPAWRNQSVPRDVEIQRERTVELRDLSIQRAQWERHIANTRQGDPRAFSVNDTFEIYDELNTYRARIVDLTQTAVVYRFDLALGEKYTFFDFWRNASEVVSVNATAAVLRTTPTTDPGEPFTYFRPWPDMTVVERVDDDVIVLRSDVPEGYTYTTDAEDGEQPVTLRVARVTDDEIIVETPNPAPLAGRTLVFDITVASLT